jgi:hypothetical protein
VPKRFVLLVALVWGCPAIDAPRQSRPAPAPRAAPARAPGSVHAAGAPSGIEPEAPATAADEEPTLVPADASLPQPFRRLGLPCGRPQIGGWRQSRRGAVPPFGEQCAAGRVAAIYDGAYSIQRPPASMRLLASNAPLDPRTDRGESYVAIEGNRMWIRFLSCGTCRAFVGWTMIGDVARMSDAQRVDLQRALGVEGAPVRSAQAWADRRIRLPSPGPPAP